MYKDFDTWNNKKKYIENRDVDFKFQEGDIWWCSIGVNIGIKNLIHTKEKLECLLKLSKSSPRHKP